MISRIAKAIGLQGNPVAITWADALPEGAAEFKAGRWGCVIGLIAGAAAKGRTAAFTRETFGCWGGGVGLGFGNCYQAFPGGVDGFCGFLADGNDKTEAGRGIAEGIAKGGGKQFAEDFLYGDHYIKTVEASKQFTESLPMRDVPTKYVIAKPLDAVDPGQDRIQTVTFFVEPDALSALTILANYREPQRTNVRMAGTAAACQAVGILAYAEGEQDKPSALVGLTDITARKNTRVTLGKHALSFTVPWKMFVRMEEDAEACFLQREKWQALQFGQKNQTES